MTTSQVWAARLGAIVALAFAPAAAAEGPGPRAADVPGPTPAPLRVENTFADRVARACTYESVVRGRVNVNSTPDGGREYALRYAPDLRVRSTVRCPNSRRPLEWERRVRGEGMSREALARAVALRGTVSSAETGARCLYRPTFDFDGARFTGTWLRRECPFGAPRGGGPHAGRGR